MIIDTFLKYLQYEKNYSTHTVFAYKRDLSQFSEFERHENNSFSIKDIDDSDIRRWIVFLMDQGNTAATVNRKLSSVKAFFRYLELHALVDTNPASSVRGPKKNKPLPNFIRVDEMDKLLDDVEFGSDFEGLRDRLILDLFYSTGMRLSELIGLRPNDLDLISGVVRVTGKRNKQRIIPITKDVIRNCEAYIEKRNAVIENQSSFLFVTSKGNAVYAKLIYRVVNKYLTAVTTSSKRSPHVLRHTFATALLNRGADINIVKSLLGHANLSATEVYTHNTFEELSKIYKQAHPRA